MIHNTRFAYSSAVGHKISYSAEMRYNGNDFMSKRILCADLQFYASSCSQDIALL